MWTQARPEAALLCLSVLDAERPSHSMQSTQTRVLLRPAQSKRHVTATGRICTLSQGDCSPCQHQTVLPQLRVCSVHCAEAEDRADDCATGRPEAAASSEQVARQAAARSKPAKPGKKPTRLPPEFKDLSSWYVALPAKLALAVQPVFVTRDHAAGSRRSFGVVACCTI